MALYSIKLSGLSSKYLMINICIFHQSQFSKQEVIWGKYLHEKFKLLSSNYKLSPKYCSCQVTDLWP